MIDVQAISGRLIPPTQRFVLFDITWANYRKISEALDERHFHLAYDGWNLEMRSKCSSEAGRSRLLARFVSMLTEELNRPILTTGDMTCERADLERAVEPCESFYLANARKIPRERNIDLSIDPPPDLAIEVDLGPSTSWRMKIYAALGVPELWLCEGDQIGIFHLESGGYRADHFSRAFPMVADADLERYLALWGEMEEITLCRSFRAWVRQASQS